MKGTASLISLGLILFISCKKELPQKENTTSLSTEKTMHDLIIPDGFDYSSTKSLEIEFKETAKGHVLYEIYTAYENYDRELIAKGKPINGIFSQQIIIPKFCEKIQVVRNVNGSVESKFLSTSGTILNHSFTSNLNRTNCTESFYAINTARELYRIDNLGSSFSSTALPDLITGGAMACAVDPFKKRIYYNAGNSLNYYDIEEKIHINLYNTNQMVGLAREMEFNTSNKLLYVAKKDNMMILDPEDNTIKGSIKIIGKENPMQDGDIAINSEGEIYMASYSGIYKLDPITNIETTTEVKATKISSNTLKYRFTSAVFDKDDRFYLSVLGTKPHLIEYELESGNHTILATLPFQIKDLGIYKCLDNSIELSDRDNDGVVDEMDDYPDNREMAFDIYTPSETKWGSLAFEDLWPFEGDYDFNDLVVNYRINQIANSENMITQLNCSFQVKAVVNSYKNGFGIELPIDQSLVKKATGSAITDNTVVLNEKGLEPGHSKAVFIVFDNAFKQVNNWGACVNYSSNPIINIVLEFTEPIEASKLGQAPFNPFIFVDSDRSREIHLVTGAPTSKANSAYMGSNDDFSEPGKKKYYKTVRNLPWAIHMAYEFVYPKEKIKINKGYHKFNDWAESNGQQYSNWYMDDLDLRNEDLLCK